MTSIASDAASTGNAKLFTIPRKPANSSTTAMSRGLTAGEDAMLAELQKLVALSSQHPVAEQELFSFKANTLLQFLGILAATVFGVFSILAWLAATKSNEISTNALNQALQSNQLALLAYCVSGGKNTSAAAICANVLNQASGEVAPIVASVLPSVPTSPIATAPASSSSLQSTESATSSDLSFSTGTSLATATSAPVPISTVQSVTTTPEATISPTGGVSVGNSAATSSSGSAPTSVPPSSVGSTKSSSTGSANSAAIIGSVVGALAGIAAVILIFWRWRAYKELSGRAQAQGRQKDSEAIL